MLKELKNSIKKLLSDEVFVGIIIFIGVIVTVFFSLFWLFDVTDDRDLRARCNSIEGKYGKGKCYVKGVEK